MLEQQFTTYINAANLTSRGEVLVNWRVAGEAGLGVAEVIDVRSRAIEAGWLTTEIEPPYSDERVFLTDSGRRAACAAQPAKGA